MSDELKHPADDVLERLTAMEAYRATNLLRDGPMSRTAVTDAIDIIREQKAKLAAMEAAVAKLPKTADGVLIVPGMELWGIYTGHENDQFREGSGTVQRWVFEPHYCSWAKYSTREAATAALAGAGEAGGETLL